MSGTPLSDHPNPIDRRPLVDWFGFAHDMHDAEVLEVRLRHPPEHSVLRMRAARMTPKMDPQGFYIMDREAVIGFELQGLHEARIENWAFCSILSHIEWDLEKGLHRLTLHSVMDGSEATFMAERIVVSVEPVAATSMKSKEQ